MPSDQSRARFSSNSRLLVEVGTGRPTRFKGKGFICSGSLPGYGGSERDFAFAFACSAHSAWIVLL